MLFLAFECIIMILILLFFVGLLLEISESFLLNNLFVLFTKLFNLFFCLLFLLLIYLLFLINALFSITFDLFLLFDELFNL